MADFMSRVVRFCLLFVLILGSTLVTASDFGDAATKGVKVIIDSDSQTNTELKNDVLIMKAPNASGVSYNSISKFEINRPLKIANTIDSYGASSKKAAKLIVIHSPAISLYNSIELLGETADILFISNTTGAQVLCSSCGFSNFGRVTLASSHATLNASMSSVGNLSNSSYGTVNINNLSAAGIDSLELIANTVTTNGLMNTNLRANYYPAGGYEIHPAGGFVVGNGGINIFARNLDVNYETLAVSRMATSTVLTTLHGKFTSAAMNFYVASPVDLRAELSTKSDLLSTSVYRGKLSATLEGINITTLGVGAGTGNISLNAIIKSDNLVSVNSSGHLYLNRLLEAKSLDLTVAGKIQNRSDINIVNSSMVGNQFENNGTIKGKKISVVSVNDLQNSYGGKLLAENITLISSNSIVRNGSQYPYRPAADAELVLKPVSHDSTQLSTLENLNYSGATKVADLSAKIIGKNISIESYSNFENINPYFVYTRDPKLWADGVVFDSAAIDRVVLIAEEKLHIKAGQYALNSSAVMGVNQHAAEKNFIINAPNIANQRYYTRVLADVVNESGETITNHQNGTSTTTSSSNGLQANLYVYSPPGVIYSFAPLQFEFSNNYVTSSAGFINNTAYFEALSDAYFIGQGMVTSIGLTLEKESYNFVTKTVTALKECYSYMMPTYNGKCQYTQTTSGNNNGTTVVNDMERTLFSVAGNIYGAQSTFFGTNHQVLDDIKQNIIDSYIAGRDAATLTPFSDFLVRTQFRVTYSNDGTTLTTMAGYERKPSVPQGVGPGGATNIEQKKIWDLLVEKLAEIKAAFLNALDAFIAWWNN